MIRGTLMALLGAGLLAGIASLFVAFQLHRFQNAAALEPQTITLADLVEKGSGDNAYVEVTGFVFGNAIIEKSGAESWAWLPLYPANANLRKLPHPPVVWRVAADEAALAQLLRRSGVTAIVSNHMPSGSPWSSRLPARFAKDYPTKEPSKTAAKTLRLAEPEASVWGWSFDTEVVLAPSTQNIAWALGGFLTLVGLGGLWWIGRGEDAADAAASSLEVTSHLKTEPALSAHAFNTWEFASRGFKISLFCGIMFAFLALLIVAGLSFLRRSPDTAFTVIGVSLGLMVITGFLLRSHFQYRTYGVAAIEVCPSGIRWVKASGEAPRVATWTQIADIEMNHVSPYPWRHFLTITLRSGEKLKLAAFSLTDYHTFAKLVHQQGAGAVVTPVASEGNQKLSTAGLFQRATPRQSAF